MSKSPNPQASNQQAPAARPRPRYLKLDRDGVYRPVPEPPRRKPCCLRSGCFVFIFLAACFVLSAALLLVGPGRTNVLLLGLDYVEPGSSAARTDTIVLSTFYPLKQYVGMISIPRDLWVEIPGVGQNRINTAHFYSEVRQPGSGPQAVVDTVEQNFQVPIDYTVRIRFEGFREIVEAMGGVDITLSEPMAGYSAGRHHLTGRKALAFVRDRANSDDFFRMSHGQVMIKALFKNMLNPLKWPRLPLVGAAFFRSVDTDIPVWMWPRLGLLLLINGPDGIDNYIISREMATPFTTDQGASVLLPNWDLIHLLVRQVFGN